MEEIKNNTIAQFQTKWKDGFQRSFKKNAGELFWQKRFIHLLIFALVNTTSVSIFHF